MQIISASVIEKGADFFLHSGYISAYPRTMGSHQVERILTDSEAPINVVEALTLKGEAASQQVGAVLDEILPTASMSVDLDFYYQLAIIAVFFCGAGFYYIYKKNLVNWSKVKVRSMGLGLLLIFSLFFVIGGTRLKKMKHKPPPWKNLPKKEFQNPELATRIIMECLLAPALVNSTGKLGDLSALQDEVGLPLVKSPTPGMRYATKSYAFDAWGEKFRITRKKSSENAYVILSSGPDRKFNTSDDLSCNVPLTSSDNWEQCVKGFFVKKMGKEYQVFFHNVKHRFFRYKAKMWWPTKWSKSGLYARAEFKKLQDGKLLSKIYSPMTSSNNKSPLIFIHRKEESPN